MVTCDLHGSVDNLQDGLAGSRFRAVLLHPALQGLYLYLILQQAPPAVYLITPLLRYAGILPRLCVGIVGILARGSCSRQELAIWKEQRDDAKQRRGEGRALGAGNAEKSAGTERKAGDAEEAAVTGKAEVIEGVCIDDKPGGLGGWLLAESFHASCESVPQGSVSCEPDAGVLCPCR